VLAALLPPATLAACHSRGASGPAPDAGTWSESSGITFIEDDYARARSEARAKGVPIFVDTWAPWCHTCLSLRAFVFPDARLRPVANGFVWLSIDTEREGNADLVSRLGVRVLPTLFVIDPTDERVRLAWPGSLTAPELVALLDDTVDGGAPRGPLAVDTAITRSSKDGRAAECAATADREAPRMPPGTALADVLRTGIECAESLPDSPEQQAQLTRLTDLGERVASDGSQPILADDRSDLYAYVVGASGKLGRDADARRFARDWSAFLEAQASRATNPTSRAVFDAHRLQAYLALGEPERAVPMLGGSEHDFPRDYNPPARLAAAYLAMKRYDEALDACRRALARAYGPRKLRLWSLEADILVGKGDTAGARAALQEAIDFASHIPLPASYPKQLDAIRARLAELR
jgi:thioredoxin-like negative regulator of GroEL